MEMDLWHKSTRTPVGQPGGCGLAAAADILNSDPRWPLVTQRLGLSQMAPGDTTVGFRPTRRLREALALVDIRVLDHLIVAGGETLSFAERGLL
jgi:hypothetical protein